MPEHPADPRRRKKTLPQSFILDLPGKRSQRLRRSGINLPRLAGLPAPLVDLADPRPYLPEFPWQPDLLGERFGFVQVIHRPFRVTFPHFQNRQRAKVGHPVPPVRLRAPDEAARLFAGESFVPSPQERLDPVVEVDAEQRVEERAHLAWAWASSQSPERAATTHSLASENVV